MRNRPKTVAHRTENRFRQRELARAVRAARDAGGERVEVDPFTGKITVIVGDKPSPASGADNEVENWLSKQQGHHENQR